LCFVDGLTARIRQSVAHEYSLNLARELDLALELP
jgi:hypothetical protein